MSNKIQQIQQQKVFLSALNKIYKKEIQIKTKNSKQTGKQNSGKDISEIQQLYNNLRIVGLTQKMIMKQIQLLEFLKQFDYNRPEVNWDQSNDWLSNIDINAVLSQIQPPNYKFLGVFASNYDLTYNPDNGVISQVSQNVNTKQKQQKCVYEEICKLNYEDLVQEGITSFGIVFNLSKYGTSGSHWVSVYGSLCKDTKTLNVYYYDSNGQKSHGDIHKFILQITNIKLTKNIKKVIVIDNPIQHQIKSNSECGMFSIFFIVMMIINNCDCYQCFRKFIYSNFNDIDVYYLRWLFFNISNTKISKLKV